LRGLTASLFRSRRSSNSSRRRRRRREKGGEGGEGRGEGVVEGGLHAYLKTATPQTPHTEEFKLIKKRIIKKASYT
jgi:hypothetical protein